MKFMLIRFGMATIWIGAACKWTDWKNWRKYYPTMLFFGMGDLIYNTVFSNKRLWEFQSNILAPYINELFVIFTIFFSTTLIYLSNLPQKLGKNIIYTLKWIALYMIIEIFTTLIGMQKNYNGWSLWWSLLHNSIQFPLLALHHKHPILSWIIALFYLVIMIKVFHVPLILK